MKLVEQFGKDQQNLVTLDNWKYRITRKNRIYKNYIHWTVRTLPTMDWRKEKQSCKNTKSQEQEDHWDIF